MTHDEPEQAWDKIRARLNAVGTPCGGSADWFVEAWHLGPSDRACRNPGDVYVLDSEDDGMVFAVVQITAYPDDETPEMRVLYEGPDVEAAISAAQSAVAAQRLSATGAECIEADVIAVASQMDRVRFVRDVERDESIVQAGSTGRVVRASKDPSVDEWLNGVAVRLDGPLVEATKERNNEVRWYPSVVEVMAQFLGDVEPIDDDKEND
jgi:hypothetical protein